MPNIFCSENVPSFCYSHFCSKNINVSENTLAITVNKFVINKLVNLKMLLTTGPRTVLLLLFANTTLMYFCLSPSFLHENKLQHLIIMLSGEQFYQDIKMSHHPICPKYLDTLALYHSGLKLERIHMVPDKVSFFST